MKRIVAGVAVTFAIAVAAFVTLSARQGAQMAYGPHMEIDALYIVSFCASHEYFAPGVSSKTWFYLKPTRDLSNGWVEATYATNTMDKEGTEISSKWKASFNVAQLCYVRSAGDWPQGNPRPN